MEIKELIDMLKLSEFDKKFPPPPSGNGDNVIRLDGMHSWDCLNAALANLSDSEFKTVMNAETVIGFDNNASRGYYSNGASWSLREYTNRNGTSELKTRLSSMFYK